MTLKKYGSLIAKLRKKNNLTQAQLGEKLNISYQAVSKWENNLSEPDLVTIEKLADIFNITVSEFFDMANNLDKIDSKCNITNNNKFNTKSKVEFTKFVKFKPWYLVAGLTVVILLLSLIVAFVPIKYSSSKIYKMVDPSVFCITLETGNGKQAGSGFFIDDKGLAVTNYHVISGATSGKVQLNNGKTYNIKKVVGCDEDLDIAIIQIDIKKSKSVKLGNSDKVKVGETVYAIGYPDPFGLGSIDSTLTQGIVSKKSYTFEGSTYIQSTVDITHGNSGGVLVNQQGKVIGIITCALTDDSGSVNYMNMAVPINKLKSVKRNLNVTLAQLADMHKDHVVTFMSDGVSFGKVTVPYNQTVESKTISKAGYQFDGWYIDENCTILFNFNKGIKVDTTLYAKWTPNTYIVKFESDSGEGYMADMVCSYGAEYQIPQNAFSYMYHKFVNWKCGSKYYSDGATFKNLTTLQYDEIVFKAQWELENYTITYISGNKYAEIRFSQPPKTQYNIESATFGLLNPTNLTDYTFVGWTSKGVLIPQLDIIIPQGSVGDKTFIANWEPNNHSITYNLDGGEMEDDKYISTYTYETPTFTLPTPTKEYYTFEGWLLEGSIIISIPQFSSGDLSIRAIWKATAYSINYMDKNGKNIKTGSFSILNCPYTINYIKPDGCYYFDDKLYSDIDCTQMIMDGETQKLYTLQTPSDFNIYLNAYYTKDDFKYSYSGDETRISTYIGDDKDVYIPNHVSKIYGNAFMDNTTVEKVYIPDNVKEISYQCFYGATALKYVQLPTNLTEIPAECFRGCTKFTNVNIPQSVTTIGWGAFASCGIESIELSNSIVTEIGRSAFSDCIQLKDIVLPTGLTALGESVFSGCTGLTKITIPHLVKSIGFQTFFNCINLEEVIMSDNIEIIDAYAFARCVKLTNVILPSELLSIKNYAFEYCESLEQAVLPEGLQELGSHVFYECLNLENVNIPSTVTRIGANPFLGTKFYNNNENWEDSVLYLDGCLLGIKYPYTIEKIREDVRLLAKSSLYYATITSIEFNELITTIPELAFYYCNKLETVVINNNVQTIEKQAFRECVALNTIVLGSGVITISENAFMECGGLQTIYYNGTQEQFETIQIAEGNGCFTNAKVYYFASIKPEVEGDYWYYDNDGNIVVWEY